MQSAERLPFDTKSTDRTRIGNNARVPRDSDRCARIRQLCESHDIVATARKQTRYPHTDRLDDTELLRRLCSLAEHEDLDEASPGIAQTLTTEASRLLRDALVTTLVDDHALNDVVAAACRRKHISGSEPQVAYCLVVLCQKADPARSRAGQPRSRTYRLDVGGEGFDEQLERWANAIAQNLRAWRTSYCAILAESKRFEIDTLLELIGVKPHDSRSDIAAIVADTLAATIVSGLPLDEMSLARARAEKPHGPEYVFQSPLKRWVGTSFTRKSGRRNDEYEDATDYEDDREDDPDDRPARAGIPTADVSSLAESETIPTADNVSSADIDERLEIVIDRVKELRLSRQRLADAIGMARKAADRGADDTRENADDAALFRRYLAELDFVLDQFLAEQRLFGQMLAYIVLAMVKSPKRHAVAIVSLRAQWLESDVRDDIAKRIRAVLHGDREPVPALITKSALAPVPKNRPRELRRLRTDPGYRASRFMAHATFLDTLPAVVGSSLDEIAAALPTAQTAGSVKATRNAAATELEAVDRVFGRSFRRYTMEGHGLR